ncbi:hypothetical protein PGTUg99_022636 [Puccinia graminis f. sp. tritici]|uniref:Uncharacterized protein n=1 Tax=Puccinia graminis f. sp. tritici TaxID=56615 RepID=A0A5B0SN56_PUCGR|nr:hypothetical protein PGTUg99_022636 [Puccinia graminis f. sp. tritici]
MEWLVAGPRTLSSRPAESARPENYGVPSPPEMLSAFSPGGSVVTLSKAPHPAPFVDLRQESSGHNPH